MDSGLYAQNRILIIPCMCPQTCLANITLLLQGQTGVSGWVPGVGISKGDPPGAQGRGPGTATPAAAVAQQAVEDKNDGLRTIK